MPILKRMLSRRVRKISERTIRTLMNQIGDGYKTDIYQSVKRGQKIAEENRLNILDVTNNPMDVPYLLTRRVTRLITTDFSGTSLYEPEVVVLTLAIRSTTSIPFITLPNTAYPKPLGVLSE